MAYQKKPSPPGISLSFNNLSGPNLAALAGGIVTSMKDNLFFPDPNPSINIVKSLLEDYNNKEYVARNRDRNAIETKSIARNY